MEDKKYQRGNGEENYDFEGRKMGSKGNKKYQCGGVEEKLSRGDAEGNDDFEIRKMSSDEES